MIDSMSENEAKIKMLESSVIDQIAAGEVVEKPSHLVKELLENSLDAQATLLEIDAHIGGRSISVRDNGSGISREQLPLALARHATSKISTSEDLSHLRSFGFRGEALASIAAVSKLKLTSRLIRDEHASQLQSEFGKLQDIITIGGVPGTQVEIFDLFENVPARLKFLKSDTTELAAIKQTVKAAALAHPQVAFKYNENGKLVFSYEVAKSLLARAEDVLQIRHLYFGECEGQGIRVRAAFSDPHKTQKNSRNIWIFAQNRWVQDRSIMAAVMEAYRNLLMSGEYPSCAVWIEVDPENIDVNIHPSKSQVKFADSSKVFRTVVACIRQVLETAPWNQSQQTSLDFKKQESRQITNLDAQGVREIPGPSSVNFVQQKIFAESDKKNLYQRKYFASSLRSDVPSTSVEILEEAARARQEYFDNRSTRSPIEGKIVEAAGGPYWSNFDVIGQINLTYIVCQDGQQMMLVDQHAAHERVAFEKLMANFRGGKIDVQEFLFPLTVDLTPEKVEVLLNHAKEIQRLGISIESVGPGTIGVTSAPILLKDRVFAAALDRVAEEYLDHGSSFSLEEIVGDIFATMACHSVVRAGQALSIEEMRSLLVEMDEFPQSSFCPHGRPVSVKFSFAQLEREFGRTV